MRLVIVRSLAVSSAILWVKSEYNATVLHLQGFLEDAAGCLVPDEKKVTESGHFLVAYAGLLMQMQNAFHQARPSETHLAVVAPFVNGYELGAFVLLWTGLLQNQGKKVEKMIEIFTFNVPNLKKTDVFGCNISEDEFANACAAFDRGTGNIECDFPGIYHRSLQIGS